MDGVSSGRYHGWDMRALPEWMEFVGTLSGLPHGCSAGMDGVCGNVIMVATWMLCGNGWSLWERYHGCHMDALWEWIEFVGTSSWLPHGYSAGMDESGRYHGWDMGALPEWMEFVGTLSGLPHGYSAGMDGVCGNVIRVASSSFSKQ